MNQVFTSKTDFFEVFFLFVKKRSKKKKKEWKTAVRKQKGKTAVRKKTSMNNVILHQNIMKTTE